jgi:hypothetical protein
MRFDSAINSPEIPAFAHHRTSDFFEQRPLTPTFAIADVDSWDESGIGSD